MFVIFPWCLLPVPKSWFVNDWEMFHACHLFLRALYCDDPFVVVHRRSSLFMKLYHLREKVAWINTVDLTEMHG